MNLSSNDYLLFLEIFKETLFEFDFSSTTIKDTLNLFENYSNLFINPFENQSGKKTEKSISPQKSDKAVSPYKTEKSVSP